MLRLDEWLTDDHARLEGLFRDLLNAAEGIDQPTLRRVWTQFEAGLLAHLDAEEQYLLPHFAKERPVAVRTIRAEHEQIRRLVAELGVATDLHLLRKRTTDDLIAALRAHAQRETQSLYPWPEQATDEPNKVGFVQTLVEEAQRRAISRHGVRALRDNEQSRG